ncbi:MAG: translocation/assembly module TamB domain-containing protein [Bdellovibrionota bacterium]|jgi:outer membrane protein insertion porin family
MNKRRLIITILFTTLLVSLILFLYAWNTLQHFGATQITALLQSEIDESCGGTFKTDQITINPFLLSATATNARIEQADNQAVLNFKKLHATFSLKRIFEHVIILKELNLIEGTSTGVTPQTPTYIFIDYLAKPLPPEKQIPGRWRLKLHDLNVLKTTINEKLGTLALTSYDTAFSLKRDNRDNFILTSSMGALDASIKGKVWHLGSVEGEGYIDDYDLKLNKVSINSDSPWITAILRFATTPDDDTVEGTLNFNLPTSLLGLDSWINATLAGGGEVSGDLDNLKLAGSIASVDTAPAFIPIADTTIPLNKLKIDYTATLDDGYSAKITNMSAESYKIDITQPISIKNDVFSGEANIKLPELNISGTHCKNADINLNLSGDISAISAVLDGSCQSLSVIGAEIPSPHLRFEYINGEMQLNLEHQQRDGGELHVVLKMSETPDTTIIDNFEVSTKDYPLKLSKNLTAKINTDLRLDNHTHSPTDTVLNSKTTATFSIDLPHFSQLNGEATIKDALFSLKAETLDNTIKIELSKNLKTPSPFKLRLDVATFNLETLSPTLACSTISLQGDYNFFPEVATKGNGKIKISELQLGCEPHRLTLLNEANLIIKNGTLFIKNLTTNGENAQAIFSGQITTSKIDLAANLKIQLALLQHTFPFVDDLQGDLEADFKINGGFSDISLIGTASIKEGEISVESWDINAHSLEGTALFSKGKISLQDLSGELNNGSIQLGASIALDKSDQNKLTVNFSDITLKPDDNLSMQISGDLKLSDVTERPTLEGNIAINRAEILQSLNLATAINALTEYLFKSKHKKTTQTLPDIALNIRLVAARNFMIISNLLQAELKGAFTIKGNLQNPKLRGTAQTISGWLAFNDHYFDITSGRVIFKQSKPDGALEVIGETTIFNNTGNLETVFLEATGSLTNPHVRLTSENNLSQNEILTLLTTSPNTEVPDIHRGTALDALSILPDDDHHGVAALLNSLTRIDAISIEPAHDSTSGTIHPAFIARKDLTDRISLSGESILSGTEPNSKLKLNYRLNDDISFMGILDSADEERNTALEANLVFTIFSKEAKLISITMSGNDSFSERTLIPHLRINQSSKVFFKELPYSVDLLKRFYHDQGYFDVKITANAKEKDGYLEQINFVIDEGSLYTIQQIDCIGDKLPKKFISEKMFLKNIGKPASKEVLENISNSILKKLRRHGYLSGSVRGRYSNKGALLSYKIHCGNITKFSFSGNSLFSDTELLETINIFRRKQPFGSNTILILLENIKNLYQKAGYADIKVNWSREVTEQSTTYNITIIEGKKTAISAVKILDLPLTDDTLDNALQRHGSSLQKIKEPVNAVDSELQQNAHLLSMILQEEGWPNADVTYSTSLEPDLSSVKIVYTVQAGAPKLISIINTVGWPEELQKPNPPNLPCPMQQVEGYGRLLLEELNNNGFIHAAVGVEFIKSASPEASCISPSATICSTDPVYTATITLNPNQRTYIREISILGNKQIDESTILKHLSIKSGMPWSNNQFQESRRNLLKLGLFSNVDFIPKDNSLNSEAEDLYIVVKERALHTLDLGVGANSELGLHLFGEATNREFFKDGRTTSIRSDIYYDPAEEDISHGIANFRYSHPSFLDTRYQLTNDLRFQKLDLSTFEFNVDRLMFNTNFSDVSHGNFSHSFGHSFIVEDLSDVSEDAILSDLDSGTNSLSILSAQFNYDRRDNPINPRNGYYATLSSSLATDLIGSDADYYMLQGRLSGLHQIPDSRFGIGANLNVAAAWAFNGTEEIPISQRYYLGGRNSVRGFRENSLGPLGSDGSVIGGDVSVLSNIELKYDLTEHFSLLTFLDSGTVFLQDEGIDFDELRWSSGGGFRYRSPIGPIGFDIAHPLDEKAGEPSIRVHFSIGSTF